MYHDFYIYFIKLFLDSPNVSCLVQKFEHLASNRISFGKNSGQTPCT